jgi:hypothetical protein
MKSSTLYYLPKCTFPCIKVKKGEEFDGLWTVYCEDPSIVVLCNVIAKIKIDDVGALNSLVGVGYGVRQNN